MNWKLHVEKTNARTYTLPEGWDSREKIAEQLDCSADGVRRALAPAIKAGEIETNVFPVWCPITKRIQRTTAYRPKPAKK